MILPAQTKVLIAVGFTDMRKSINGLCQLVDQSFDADLFSGNLFVFCNRRRDIIKILFWDKNGFCIWYKRLEKDRFRWPNSPREVMGITPNQLSWLLAGLDISTAHKQLTYQAI